MPEEQSQRVCGATYTKWLPCIVLSVIVFIAGLLLCTAYDQSAYHLFANEDTGDCDWHRMFRVCGYVPVWLLMAMAYALMEWPKVRLVGFWRAMTKPLLLIVPILISAGMVEIFKLILRRERPNMHDGVYFWRPLLDRPFDSSGLGLPSSHAAIAFTAAFCLCYLFPRASVVWLFLAVGCAISRVINHAHFLSDVYVSAVLALIVVLLTLRWYTRRRNNINTVDTP